MILSGSTHFAVPGKEKCQVYKGISFIYITEKGFDDQVFHPFLYPVPIIGFHVMKVQTPVSLWTHLSISLQMAKAGTGVAYQPINIPGERLIYSFHVLWLYPVYTKAIWFI